MKMKVYSAIYDEQKNAAPKAPGDINAVLQQHYDAKIVTMLRTGGFKYRLLWEFAKCIFYKGIVVLQHPLLFNPKVYDLLPAERTVILIHDISGLRRQDKETLDKEVAIFKKFKYIIVHNAKMAAFLKEQGVEENTLFVLDIFDYLTEESIDDNAPQEMLRVMYPGNLRPEKTPFIYQLDSKRMKFGMNLYGLGLDKDLNEKMLYKGAFEPEQISCLEGDLGLIWDGDMDERDENLTFKNYTKFNNPHKLSCCLAAGKPVIVWSKAAVADFVLKHNVGYVIDTIYDINELDFSDLAEKKKNALSIGYKLRHGNYTKRVFEEILAKM